MSEQRITFRLATTVVRPREQNAKDIEDQLLQALAAVPGVEATRVKDWRREDTAAPAACDRSPCAYGADHSGPCGA